MWDRQKFSIQIFILLLTKVSRIQSDCQWENSVGNCSMKCEANIFETLNNIKNSLSKRYKERILCDGEGVDLSLKNIPYSDSTVSADFFPADIKVRKLTIKLNIPLVAPVQKIKANAFNINGLKFLKQLVIKDVMFEPIKKGTFNGLENLEVLNIDGMQLGVETGILDVLNGTLKEFSLGRSETEKSNKEISIDGLTGAKELDKLETVKFRYNLKTALTRSALVGLTNVKTLDLSDCRIEAIAVGSFDSLTYLEILKLEDNQLTSIPDGFFSNILIRNKTQIYLQGNPFVCDCALMPFKMSVIRFNSNFIGELTCDKPIDFKNDKLIESKYDENCVVPTTPSPSSPTTPIRQCQLSDKPETIFVDPPGHTMEIYQTEDNVVMLRVDELSENSILIWFSISDPMTNLTAVKPNCLIGPESTFQIRNLGTNIPYTLCLMDHTKMTTSPLDCVSFVKRSGVVEPWIYQNAKSRFIGITFVACSVGIFLGSAIGGLTYKIWAMKRKEPCIRSYQSSRCSSMSRSRTSVMTRRKSNTTVQYFINENNDAPPLPARPASMYLMDEPVYATIRDIRCILALSQAPDKCQASNEIELETI